MITTPVQIRRPQGIERIFSPARRVINDLTVLAPRWRNLYFIRGGRTVWSKAAVESEAACLYWSAEWFAEVREWLDAGGFEFCDMEDGTLVLYDDFMFAIPMPVRGSGQTDS